MGTKLTALREAIGQVDHGPMEFVVKATCADVWKATYSLRLHGDRLLPQDLSVYADVLRDSLGVTVGGSLSDNAWLQATCGIKDGGV
eukprot:13441343-Heterocapsa_arctica.AAC.1